MSAPVVLTLIVPKELAEEISVRARTLLCEACEPELESLRTETYWKDSSMMRVEYELVPRRLHSKNAWKELFDGIVPHQSVTRDGNSIEIAHYSAPGDGSDPFSVLYIPREWVAEE